MRRHSRSGASLFAPEKPVGSWSNARPVHSPLPQTRKQQLLFQAVTAVTNFGLTDFHVLCSPTGKARDEGPLRCRHGMPDMDHSRLGGASWRSSHVRDPPLATVGPKKAACRDGPNGDIPPLARGTRFRLRNSVLGRDIFSTFRRAETRLCETDCGRRSWRRPENSRRS